MKKTNKTPFIIIGAVLLVLLVVLYFFNPLAPVLLLLSIVIQIPIIWGITRAAMNNSYDDRAYERRMQYEKDGDAAAWLAEEERETAALGTRFWSSRTKSLSALNRAAPLAALGRWDEAAAMLAEVEEKRLESTARARFAALLEEIRSGENDPPAQNPDPAAGGEKETTARQP